MKNTENMGKIISLLCETEETEVVELLDLTSEQLVKQFETVVYDRLEELEHYFGVAVESESL